MAKKKIDYSKTEIYKLIHKDNINNENIYIGSTTNFSQRKRQHKSNCNNEKSKNHNAKVYQNIRENDGWTEWSMLLVEKFSCVDKKESLVRERYWIDHFKSQLNIVIPGRTKKEWGNDNKEKITEYRKEYYQYYKEEIDEQNKNYRNTHKQEIKENSKIYNEKNKGNKQIYHKIYNEINKEKIDKKNKENYEKNKGKISEKAKEKIQCECGFFSTKPHLLRHQKTKKHLDLMSTTIT